MNYASKTVWSEGLFMRPQHFQQQERYFESSLHQKVSQIDPDQFGFHGIEFDEAELQQGRIRVLRARGTFEDGQAFDLPGSGELPSVLTADAGRTAKVFGLCLPLSTDGQAEIELETEKFDGFGRERQHTASEVPTRFEAAQTECWDVTVKDNGFQSVYVAKMNCLLKWEDQDYSSFSFLPVGRVRDVTADGAIRLDPDFIPTCISVSASVTLGRMASDFAGIVEQQARTLAQRISTPGQSGVADVSDFMRLMALNRIGTQLRVMAAQRGVHPKALYMMVATAVGELATFSKAVDGQRQNDRLPPQMVPYDHRYPTRCFIDLQGHMNALLSQQSEGAATPIPLKSSGANGFSALLQSGEYFDTRELILAVKADVGGTVLKDSFPAQSKLGPRDKMRELIAYQVPGIRLEYLPVVPRQLPYHAGFLYFRVERGTDLWRAMLSSRQLELYIGGRFQGLELELWAVRG